MAIADLNNFNENVMSTVALALVVLAALFPYRKNPSSYPYQFYKIKCIIGESIR